MQTVDVVVKVPKESKEVVDLLEKIVEKVKAKSPLSGYADLLDELMVAVEGAQGIAEEVKSEHVGGLAGYAGDKIVRALYKPAAPAQP
jgi:hypothetical protein